MANKAIQTDGRFGAAADRRSVRHMKDDSTAGRCALCLEAATLRASHIVPEFCYGPTYDAKHRGRLLSTETMRRVFVQKGLREHLLCDDCEQRLGRHEKYFKEFWFDRNALPGRVSGAAVQVVNLNYRHFKLFHLSILWRCGVASRKEFSSVDLGPYSEKLRQALLAADPGPEGMYPFYSTVIVNDDSSVAYGLVSGPYRSRLDHFAVYYMCYAGCEWTFIVTDHNYDKYKEWTVKGNSPFTLVARPIADLNTIRVFREQRDDSV